MKKIFLILSLLFIAGCKMEDYPDVPTYSTDIINKVCVKWSVVDKQKVLFKRVSEAPLSVGGPCDHMMGYAYPDLKTVQNWVRDN